MKIAQFRTRARSSYGVVSGNGIVEPTEGFTSQYETLQDVLAGDALKALAKDVDGRPGSIKLEKVQLLPPLGPSSKIICVGINYRKKYPVEGAAPAPDNIILFAKHHDAIVGHGEALELPRGEAAATFDYEGEIVLVIGKADRHIARDDAHDHIAGYTIMDDGSVRGWQKHSLHAGKNFARSGGCGPWIVTADEIKDASRMTLTTVVNGETRQQTDVASMIFPPDELVSYISHFTPLAPGDMIATGSPEGAGGSYSPPRFLKAGDTVEISVSGIGTLRNRVEGA
jgi:2-keto-4-pentenoate hydratase/2-oxohepta-3-ene-1,7-dioic acid hydratase in catechol pathway